ncbi:SDR family NAD(P)-dependent oxidoreductase [Acuticoccus sp. 2012]|uniref:SDR family NAD(P)-dependent oxidoreductase n=1 Tax=Acuticoccus mangrovi TaxID=2796142 RepID=A0A934IS38_9HYPH|nr:SDR family NAD(P)-dependent oxidoreductase [Acuticoccus mangrovi]
MDLTPLAGRLAVVTGATRGIGWAVATELARHGVHVIAVGRKVEALEELDDALRAVGTAGTLVPLDMTDGQGVDRLGGSINDRWGKVDIVVGNAGVLGQISPLAHVKAPTWQETLDVNVTANWRLIRTLDPLLRRSDAGRCVFVTSGAVAKLRPFWGPYSVSKAALDALVKTYANETATTAVRANLFSPGAVRTAMRAAAVPGEDPDTLPTPADVAPSIAALCAPGMERSGATYSFRDRDFI